MKYKLVLAAMGLVFSVMLAIIVGQRLSDQLMVIVVGVVAGVAASIPSSLVMVSIASRLWVGRQPPPAVSRPPESAPETRYVVMPPQPTPTYAAHPAGYPTYPPATAGMMMPPQPRKYQVIGGAQVSLEEPPEASEDLWQP